MDVLYVSRSNSGYPHPFIQEQAAALSKNFNISIQHFLIRRGGLRGYIKAAIELSDFIKHNKTDIVHVHYGLSALVAVINKVLFLEKLRLIITYHGSDINKTTERPFSLFAAHFASHNVLVSEKMLKYINKKSSVISCGIDTDVELIHRESTREAYGWGENDFVILFSSSFAREEKDPEFAFQVVDALTKTSSKTIKFVEMKGYTREQVTKLMQAADVLIMCSKTEGSPQVIKEAVINSLPVISNDVGDVRSICAEVDNCFIISKEVDAYVKCLQLLSESNARVKNRTPVISKYDNTLIAHQLYNVYTQALK